MTIQNFYVSPKLLSSVLHLSNIEADFLGLLYLELDT